MCGTRFLSVNETFIGMHKYKILYVVEIINNFKEKTILDKGTHTYASI